MKQKLKSGDEYDLIYGRGIYKYLERAGVKKWIRRKLNKRFRREGKRIDIDQSP
jgi:hypothetical protein